MAFGGLHPLDQWSCALLLSRQLSEPCKACLCLQAASAVLRMGDSRYPTLQTAAVFWTTSKPHAFAHRFDGGQTGNFLLPTLQSGGLSEPMKAVYICTQPQCGSEWGTHPIPHSRQHAEGFLSHIKATCICTWLQLGSEWGIFPAPPPDTNGAMLCCCLEDYLSPMNFAHICMQPCWCSEWAPPTPPSGQQCMGSNCLNLCYFVWLDYMTFEGIKHPSWSCGSWSMAYKVFVGVFKL